jgi:hypothetical protein
MNEEEVARLVRARARAWRGGHGSAKQSRWAQAPRRRRRWAWLPAVTALVSASLFTAAAAAYARGPAPVRQVLAPVGDRVSLPWHSDSREDHTGTQVVEKVQTDSSPGQPTSKPVGSSGGPAVVAPRHLEDDRAGSGPQASPTSDDRGGESSGRLSGAPAHRSSPTPSPEPDSEHR